MKTIHILILSTLIASFLRAESYRGIEGNVIKSYANTNDEIVVDGKPASAITYMSPKEIEIPVLDKETPLKPKTITVEKDYTDVFVYSVKSAIDRANNNFIKSQGTNGHFVDGSTLNKYNTISNTAQEKMLLANKKILKGTCIIRNDIYIQSESMAKLNCRTDRGEYINVMMKFVPNNKAYALKAIPFAYIDSRGGMKDIDKDRSYVLNYNSSSDNIATMLNTHMIENSIATFTGSVAGGIGQATNNVMNQLASSMTTEEIVVVNSELGGSVSKTNNTRRPTRQDVKDYGVIGLAQGIVGGVEKIMSNIIDNKEPWSYKIAAKTTLKFIIREM